jgi:hypothetical protein
MSERQKQPAPPPAWQPPTCAECGSPRLEEFVGNYGTGVVAEDGYAETWWYDGVKCLDCGYFEDWS